MATANLSPVFVSINGRVGSVVFYRRRNTQCVRAHIIPRNPDTKAQRTVRLAFADAVKSWQAMTGDEKYMYVGKARNLNMSGYNLYISEYMKRKIYPYRKQEIKPVTESLLYLNSVRSRIPSVSDSSIRTPWKITDRVLLQNKSG